MFTLVVRERAGCALVCPVCRVELGTDQRASCAECGTEHHSECIDAQGCASMNCVVIEDDRTPRAGLEQSGLEQNPLWQAIHGPGGELRAPWYHHRIDDDGLVITVGYTASYDDQDVLFRANRRALEAEFSASGLLCSSDYDGARVHILSSPANGEDWSIEQSILESLNSLEQYPCLDEQLWSELEHEEIVQQLDDYALRDAVERLELWEQNAIEDMPKKQKLSAYWQACGEAGEYPACSGSEIHWPDSDAWFAAFREELGIAGMTECRDCYDYPAAHDSGCCAHCEDA